MSAIGGSLFPHVPRTPVRVVLQQYLHNSRVAQRGRQVQRGVAPLVLRVKPQSRAGLPVLGEVDERLHARLVAVQGCLQCNEGSKVV